jgi:acylphosphatase
MHNARVRLKIYGRVQGVFFRASTLDKAKELGLSGWVRNNPDGSVEVLAEGFKEGIEKLVEWSRAGPRHAVVNRVDIQWERFVDEFTGFTIE